MADEEKKEPLRGEALIAAYSKPRRILPRKPNVEVTGKIEPEDKALVTAGEKIIEEQLNRDYTSGWRPPGGTQRQNRFTHPDGSGKVDEKRGRGRPKDAKSISGLLEQRINKKQFVDKILELAYKGDMKAIKLIMTYVEGLPAQLIDMQHSQKDNRITVQYVNKADLDAETIDAEFVEEEDTLLLEERNPDHDEV